MDATSDPASSPAVRPLPPGQVPRLVEVLAWVYAHRFVTSSHLTQGFPLGSERTARRYLRQLLDHRLVGCLPVRDGLHSDHRVYFVSGRGLSLVTRWRADEGLVFAGLREDSRQSGKALLTTEHEKGLTSLQIRLEESLKRAGGALVFSERRYRHPDRQLTFSRKGVSQHFHPDLGFLARQATGRLFPLCLVEFDRSSKPVEKLYGQLFQYLHWSRSSEGTRYLVDLYRTHGSPNPQPIFRLLFVIDRGIKPERAEAVRVAQLLDKLESLPDNFQGQVWLVEAAELRKPEPLWLRSGGFRLPLY